MSYNRSSHLRHLVLVSLLLLINSLIWTPSAQAESGPVDVRTYSVDYGAFPDVCLRVAPVTDRGIMPSGLTLDSFQIYENGEPRPAASVGRQYVGSQIAVVLDASGSFARPGLTGSNRRFDDAIEALDELLLSKKWLQDYPQVDQMLLIAPTGRDSFKIAASWTTEPVYIHNGAYVLSLVNTDTPLYKMLIEAMVRMKDIADYDQRAKFLLVFSDGIDRTSANDVTDVINRANSLGVKILAVKIGPEGAGKTLQRMAEETPRETRAEWAYVDYKGPNSLTPLYQVIKAQAEQYVVCYRSKINQPGPQSIEVGVRIDGREYKSTPRSVAIPIQPAAVRIIVPADGVVYDRVATHWDQDPVDIEPRAEAVTVEVAWPDNFPRAIERVLYEVDGSVVGNLSADEAFVWDFSRLPAGVHSLRVIVRDELGIESRSDPVRATINIVIPPAPTPTWTLTPTATPVPPLEEQLVRNTREQPMLIIVLVIAIIAAALALYALIRLLRNPAAIESMTTTVAHVVRDATEIFRPKRGPAATSRAYLIPLIDDLGTRGKPIPIRWQTTLVGRDPARVQIVFADKTVSRLHARIVEEGDYMFELHDEGSSSGTYVNDVQVVVSQPHRLKSGDRLEFGRVRAIFQLAKDADETTAAEETEPMVARQHR